MTNSALGASNSRARHPIGRWSRIPTVATLQVTASGTKSLLHPMRRWRTIHEDNTTDQDSKALLQAILTASGECQAAFCDAATKAQSAWMRARFLRRMDYHRALGEFASGQMAIGVAKPLVPIVFPRLSGSDIVRASDSQRALTPQELLRACVRASDSAILEFSRAFTPTMALTDRVRMERHHAQMRWTRDELLTLRRTKGIVWARGETVDQTPRSEARADSLFGNGANLLDRRIAERIVVAAGNSESSDPSIVTRIAII
ncbi:MAG: hypothetical protein ABIT38_21460 [Gemmatimonadaceae bacterium]